MPTTFIAQVRTEGKITIPAETRRHLILVPGDIIKVTVEKPNWYEMIDWTQMNPMMVNLDKFPKKAVDYIHETYTYDPAKGKWTEK